MQQAPEIGDVGYAATEVEYLVDDLIGGNSSTLNPFLFRHFWLSVDTRWPAGGETGILLVRIINDGDIPLPMMRLAPPVPEGWTAKPSYIDVPVIGPGATCLFDLRFMQTRRHGADEIPLSRKLSIATGYEMRNGNVTVTVRAQNRSMEPLVDVLIQPWMPPGFTADKIPFISRLTPDEVAVIRIPLRIDLGHGGAL